MLAILEIKLSNFYHLVGKYMEGRSENFHKIAP